MIDWVKILYHVLWIVGLASLLAAFSLAHWMAGARERSLGQILTEPHFRLATAVSILLIALGLMLIVSAWWQKIGWFGMGIVCLWEGIDAWRHWPTNTSRI